jgi:drug/metabolite transporter (DMT)-like permease
MMTRRAWILMVALAALWGASYMFIRIAIDDGVPAPVIVWVRIALGALALSLMARGALAALRGNWRPVSLVGLVQVAGPFLLITYGQRWIPSSLAAILVASAPIFVALLAPVIDRADALGRWGIIGIATGIVGVTLLFGVDLSGEGKLALGGAMVLLASVGYAFGAIWVRRDLGAVPAVAVAAGTMIVASALTFVPALVSATGDAGDIHAGTVAALLVLGVGGTGVAFYMFYALIADVGASRASVVAYLAPGFAVTYGALFLDETITVTTLAGLALILAGCWIAAEGRAPWDRTPRALPPEPAVAPEPCGEELLSRSEPSRSSEPLPVRGR